MKIAFATQDLKRVDAHFGWAKNIAIYEIGPQGHRFLEAIQFDGDLKEDGNEDKLAPKIDAIKDCAILYVAAIGGSGAAPPPWLRKALAKGQERTFDFDE
ncbi:MAG: nitrogen fixation protein NifX [Rhizobiales bacterium 24-66-13]|nr:MAG: nitrogen fixation protein NifX [Rhizobiales bacterium 24-66-13]